MRLIQTDDAAARLSYIFLGPVGVPFPFAARLSMLGAGTALTIGLSVVTYVATPFISFIGLPGIAAWFAHATIATAAGLVGGVLLTRKLAKVITPYMPWSHHFESVRAEINTPRPDATTRHYKLGVPAIWIEDRPESRQVRVATVPAFVTDEHRTH